MIGLTVVCEFLGKKPDQAGALVEDDGLAVVRVPARTRPVRKVLFSSLYRWVCEHCEGEPPGREEFKQELEEFLAERKGKAA